MRLPFDSLIFYNRLVSVNVGYPFHPFTASPMPSPLKNNLSLLIALNDDEYAVLIAR